MKILTHTQLTELLAAKRGAVILSIVSRTEPKFRKTGCPYSLIEKIEYKRVVVGADYGKAVKKQVSETTGSQDVAFTVSPRKWGTYIVPRKVVAHNGNLYLVTQARNAQPPIKTVWLADGVEVNKETIKDYLVTSSSAKQESVGLYGRRQVMERDFTMGNVLRVKIDGCEYILIPSPEAEMKRLANTLRSIEETINERRKATREGRNRATVNK